MGFKRENYEIKGTGITIPEAYAQIQYLAIDFDGSANAMFAIQQSREKVATNDALETKPFSCKIDKDKPVYEQVYRAAKKDVFKDWEDDIVYETII